MTSRQRFILGYDGVRRFRRTVRLADGGRISREPKSKPTPA
jgi:hypothetical protein